MRRIDVDPRQLGDPLERPKVVDPHLDAAGPEQVVHLGIGHLQVGHADLAGEAERELRPLLERQRQVGAHEGRLQPHRQALRQIAEPRSDIEALEPDLHRAGAALGERRGDGGRIEAAAVEGEGQPRLDTDLALRRQGAQEGHTELEVAQPMRRLQRLVDEVGRAAVDDDVVQRELRRLVAVLRRRRRQARHHVVDVVAAVGEARQADHRRVDLQPIDHRREAEHPTHRDLAAQLPDLQLRRGGVARPGQGDVVDPQRQRPWVESDVADGEAPAERLERDPLGPTLECRRHDQRGRAPERRQDDDGDAGANQPAACEEAAHAVLVRVGRARCRSR